jgi:hypothetical protein
MCDFIPVLEHWYDYLNPRMWRDNPEENTTFDYTIKALKWFIMNAAFGLFPLLFMLSVSLLTNGVEGESELNKLIYEGGVIFFVIIAMMGSIAID